MLSDADARRRAVDAAGSVLVQAPAGSGKTTLLAQRCLRLLAAVDAPERILALTFTRRAAQEMRERVLTALQAAAEGACPAGMNEQTFRLGVEALRHLSARDVDLLRHPARLRIETIDSFNAWLAGQLPVTAGSGSRMALTEKPQRLYLAAARRALAHDAADGYGVAVDRVLALDDQRWQSLVELIAGMLPSRDRWLPLLTGSSNAVRGLLDEDLAMLVTRKLREAEEVIGVERLRRLSRLLHGAASRCAGPRPDLDAWRANDAVLEPSPQDLPRWRGACALLLTKQPAYRTRMTKSEGFPVGCIDKQAMLDLVAELQREPRALRLLLDVRALPNPAYDDAQWHRAQEVAQVLVLAAAQLLQVFREEATADFPEVSMAALRALGTASEPTDLTLRLDYRLQHVLVDEFQDTSSAQLALIKQLTAGWQRGDGRSLFCVGDPMQSIYGFRDAEVRAFLELAQDGIGDVEFEVQRLTSNFRSSHMLVEWINRCFARILPAADDRQRGAIAFRPSHAMTGGTSASTPVAGEGDTIDARGGGRTGAAPGPWSGAASGLRSGAANDHATAAVRLGAFASRDDEASAVAEAIAQQLARQPRGRVAVLVRARTHAQDIAAALRRRGIVFNAVDIEPLQDHAVVRDLVMLIGALLHRGYRTAWLTLLRAPWCGLDLADLWAVAQGAPSIWEAMNQASVLARLSEEGRARCTRVRGVLEAAFRARSTSSVTRWVERTWLALGGPSCAPSAQEFEHAHAVFARLAELEEQGMPDVAELGARFADLYAISDAPAAVELMTIHKAKGLEFDMVVVPALERSIPSDGHPLLLSHQFDRSGRGGLVLAARPGVGQDTDALFEFLRRQGHDAARLEAQRLLYVACTRAKSRLLLTATRGGGEDAEEPKAGWKPRAGSLLAVLWPVAAAEFGVVAPSKPEDLSEAVTPGGSARPGAAVAPTEPEHEDVAPGAHPAFESSAWEVPASASHATPRRAVPRVPVHWSPEVDTLLCAATPEPEALPDLGDATPVFDWAGETARRVGSLVHAELQTLEIDAAGGEEAVRAREGAYRQWLTLQGVPADRLSEAVRRTVSALTAVHRDPRGRWILRRGYRDDFREHALTGRWQGEVIRIVFDRSFVDEQGIRWVIDYKTSVHGGGSLEEFLDREVERYRAQLERYAGFARRLGAEPVRVGLYFPLMRAWREWTP